MLLLSLRLVIRCRWYAGLLAEIVLGAAPVVKMDLKVKVAEKQPVVGSGAGPGQRATTGLGPRQNKAGPGNIRWLRA
jgi:hypothetical protein